MISNFSHLQTDWPTKKPMLRGSETGAYKRRFCSRFDSKTAKPTKCCSRCKADAINFDKRMKICECLNNVSWDILEEEEDIDYAWWRC